MSAPETGADVVFRTLVQALEGDATAYGVLRANRSTWDRRALRRRIVDARPDLEYPFDATWPATENGTAARPAGPKLFAVIDDAEAETLAPPEWGIDPLYPQGGLVLLYGMRGKGKTFLGLGWAFAHATGLPWEGHAAREGSALYIMAEGRGGLGQRVRAQKEYLQVPGDAGSVGVNFIAQAVPTLDAAEVDRLLFTIDALPERPSVIVWDTLSRTFIGGDENSGKDMAQYVANVDRVREVTGATGIIVHHTGHGSTERERGSSVLGGAADTIIALREKDGLLELACDKQKDASEFAPMLMQLQPVGESCVISLQKDVGVIGNVLTPNERQALTKLQDAFLDDGAAATAWMEASGLATSSFYHARTSLVRRDFVEVVGKGRGARYVLTPHGASLTSLQRSKVTP